MFVRVCICMKACSNHGAREGCDAVEPNFFFYASSNIKNNVNVILLSTMESAKCVPVTGLRCKCIRNDCRLPDVISSVCFDTDWITWFVTRAKVRKWSLISFLGTLATGQVIQSVSKQIPSRLSEILPVTPKPTFTPIHTHTHVLTPSSRGKRSETAETSLRLHCEIIAKVCVCVCVSAWV